MVKNIYLQRYAYPITFIKIPPSQKVGIIITIPCYNEPDLLSSIHSIAVCKPPNCHVEVIVVINNDSTAPNNIKAQNLKTYQQATKWAQEMNTDALCFQIVYADDLPKKHAGVGLARKIAMDEAVKRFELVGNKDGIIVCFDADSLCDSSYLVAIENHFKKHPKTPGCSIYYEHPLEGTLTPLNYEAIIDYELFLRYYTNAQKFAHLPYAYQTVGSSMAVRIDAYQKQGGMNKRKAGEDFYFLNKIMALGNFSELNNTKIIPSARQSDRVPFGTGKAVIEWLSTKSLDTYNPKSFIDLKKFVSLIDTLYNDPETAANLVNKNCSNPIQQFLRENDFEHHLMQISLKSSSFSIFKNHFYQWFNAFKVLKFIHFCRDNYYTNISIQEAAKWLLNKHKKNSALNSRDLLMEFRKLDNQNNR